MANLGRNKLPKEPSILDHDSFSHGDSLSLHKCNSKSWTVVEFSLKGCTRNT